VPWTGTARLEGAALSLAIRITSLVEGGDHLIVVGQVGAVHHGLGPIEPLIFFDRRYHGIDGGSGNLAPEIDPPGAPSQLFHDPWE
jgi:flavin reductase (DIM6/NTAB) family NADH-FMN oxidoreductase RutF